MSERIIFQTITSDARCYAIARRVARDEFRVTLYQWQPRFAFRKVDRLSTYETNDADDACNTAVAMVFPRDERVMENARADASENARGNFDR